MPNKLVRKAIYETSIPLILSTADKIKPEFEKPKMPVAAPVSGQKVAVHNYGGNVSFECYVHAPKSLHDIIRLFVQARQAKLKIRPVGAFHSWS